MATHDGQPRTDGTARDIPSAIKNADLLTKRRAKIVEIATELFIARGFSEVSVNEIAAASNMSIGSLYKYIRSKDDILWLVMDEIYGQLDALLTLERAKASEPRDALVRTFCRFLEEVQIVRRGILLMYREYRHLPLNGQREFMQRERRVVDIFRDILIEGNISGVFQCPQPEIAAIAMLMAGHTWSLKGWLLRGTPLDQYTNEQLHLALMMAGLRPDEDESS